MVDARNIKDSERVEMKKIWAALGVFLVIMAAAGAAFLSRSPFVRTIRSGRHQQVLDFIRNPEDHEDWVIDEGSTCGSAPFLFPTRGFAGYLWDDSFRMNIRHQGIDIFAGSEVGVTPIVAAYDGFLTRLPDWKSTVIIRVPSDPLEPGRQIWLYFTHMADGEGNSLIDSSFPPGSSEVPVSAGTLLGYQGNFSGTAGNPVGVHLHFSIVLDDGNGKFLNELEIGNTLDPSPYLGLELNAGRAGAQIPLCESAAGR